MLPFRVALYTKTREFQYKILNRYLVTNVLLNKIGIKFSTACTLCGDADESLEHLFTPCPNVLKFWTDLIAWLKNINVILESPTAMNILLGLWKQKDDFLFLNHILLIAKKYIYHCRNVEVNPCHKVFISRTELVYQIETKISKTNSKLNINSMKWGKFTNNR